MPTYLGIDVDSKSAVYTLLDEDGNTIASGSGATSELLSSVGADYALIEHSGRLANAYTQTLTEAGTLVYLFHSKSMHHYRAILHAGDKTDDNDAKLLSRLIRDYIRGGELTERDHTSFTAWPLLEQAWEVRELLSSAHAAQADHTRTLQRIQANRKADPEGKRLPLHALELQQSTALETANKQHAQALSKAVEYWPTELQLLCTIPGIDNRTAVVILSQLMPISRFAGVKQAINYTGMRVQHKSSGNKKLEKPRLHDKRIRSLSGSLWMAAITLSHSNSSLGAIYTRLRAAHSGKRTATDLACRLLRISYGVLKSGQPFRDHVTPEKPPSNLISQSAYARRMGISRQAVFSQVKRGALACVEWKGRKLIEAPTEPAEVQP